LDEDLAEARKKKIAQMQKQQEQDSQKKMLLKNLVEPAAYERLMNVKLANPELYDQVVNVVAYVFKSGNVKGRLTEGQILQLLEKLRGKSYEPTITVKRKEG